MNTPAEAWSFFLDHWLILLSMPVVAGFIGWITKVLAIEMVFRPIEFRGIGPIGWQGQLPRRAAKFASQAAEIILDNVIEPRELVDRLDPRRVAAELDDVVVATVEDLARELTGERWDRLPAAVRGAIVARARARAPQLVENLLTTAKENIDEAFQLSYIVTAELIRDKVLLNDLVRGPMAPIMGFMRRFGLLFGAFVGSVQMVVFAFTESHTVIPVFGLVIGLVSDWLALQMLFHPKERKRYLGIFPWYGMAFAYRDHFVREYGVLAAERIFTPKVLLDAMLEGPLADRLFVMVHDEVHAALDAELGLVEPLVPAAIGSARYQAMRSTVVARAQAAMPAAAERLEPYAAEAMDVENTLRATLSALTNEELEEMLRPVFKDDEWLVVAVGGGLGFVVGELQVLLLTTLGGL
ncbi:hypothetical protein GCM10011584_33630 [Nocardioides phosphati]|uniref:DUF445 domain-containing protein n=1 Tax=Nocardioides phosphati TaxID=1867775 RepID=A0ABQ2NDJ0_9ACTN|nr:DUF445 family protein [Nocardioides phosphati]GGO93891.1 hypothetical protein GCM10011584_33630 [Nocardioides phosphati]